VLELVQRELEARHPREPDAEVERRARRLPHGLVSKDGILGEGKQKMTWHGGTHELGRRIGKLLSVRKVVPTLTSKKH
jgi:hypothetical protein